MAEQSTRFTDALGFEWNCRFTTPALIAACQDLNITIAALKSPDSLNFGVLASLVWYASRAQANERGVGKAKFFESHLTPDVLSVSIVAAFQALADAFPQPEPKEAGAPADPLEPGNPGE
jgi:hypothetical protein